MKKCFYRIDCSGEVGMGHLSRANIFVDYFPDFSFELFIYGARDLSEDLLKKFKKTHFLNSPLEFPSEDLFDLGIFDFSTKYTFECKKFLNEYFHELKKKARKVLLIDGLGNDSLICVLGEYRPNFLLVPYAGASNNQKAIDFEFVGPEYFIFSKEILELKVKKANIPPRNVLITMGGGDPFGLTEFLLDVCTDKILNKYNFKIVIGPYFKKEYANALFKKNQGFDNIQVVTGENGLTNYIAQSDVVISASGLTKYEAAKLKRPILIFCHDDNSFNNNVFFEQAGLSKTLGVYKKISLEKAKNEISQFLNDANSLHSLEQNCSLSFDGKKFDEFVARVGE